MTTDYGEDTGSLIMASMITKGIFAVNDIDTRYNPMDLTLGANGGINMIVGNNSGPNVPDNCISLVNNFKGTTGVYNFEVHGSAAIALQPADLNSTVYIGDAMIYSDAHNVYLSTFDKALALAVDNLAIDGSLVCKDNLKVDGEIYTGEINITKNSFNGSNIVGYAFKVNQLNSNLELVKYYHDYDNSNLNRAQLVASFGKGPIINDLTHSYNLFEQASSNASSSNNQSGSGSGSGGATATESVWSVSGNDIFYGGYGGTQQRVGINTSNPMYPLDVVGTVQAIEFRVGPTLRGLEVSGSKDRSRAVGIPVIDFNFTEQSYTVGPSYSDPLGNTFTHNGKLHEFSNGSFKTVFDLLELYLTPNDWSIFSGLGNNFRMYYKMNVQYTNKDLNTDPFMTDRFISEFVYPSGGSLNERGFRVHLKTSQLFFEGYARFEDGNTIEKVFSVVFDASVMADFFGTVHEWEFQFSTFEIGSNAENASAWGLAKILIDGVERAQTFVTNVTNFSAQTQQDGVYLYTANAQNPNGYYRMFIGPGTTELYEFEMGKLDDPTLGTTSSATNGEDITISERGIQGLNSIEVSSEYLSGIYFRDIISPGVGSYWNGHASNLFGIGELPLSMFGNDMNLSDFYKGTGETWFDTTPSQILLSSFSNDILDSGDPVFDSCTVLGALSGHSVAANSLVVTSTTMVNQLDVDQNLHVVGDTTLQGTLSVAAQINVPQVNSTNVVASDTVTADKMVCATSASVNKLDISGLLDASNVTAFINQLVAQQVQAQMATISGTLSVGTLATNIVNTNLVPNGNEVLDLGTPTNKWRDLYLSGNTLYMDEFLIQVDEFADTTTTTGKRKELRIKGGNVNFGGIKFKEETKTIEFEDGTTIGSINEIGSTLATAEGELFGDFTTLKFEVYNSKGKTFIQSITGTYSYSRNHNVVKNGNKWNYLDFGERKVPPIKSSGRGFDRDKDGIDSLKTGANPKTFSVSLVKSNKPVGQNIFLTADENDNVNQMFHLRTLDPFSVHFQNKCKADFSWFYNQHLYSLGEYVYDKEIYFDKGEEFENHYVQINDVDNFVSRETDNKFYDVEFIYYYKPPEYETKYITEEMKHKYLVPNSPVDRLDKVYEVVLDNTLGIKTYQLVLINEHFGLYPRITLQRWDNSMNTTDFQDVIYDANMNWGAGGVDGDQPELNVVYQRFKDNGWLRKLFYITYNYVKYGVVEGDIPDIPTSVKNDFYDIKNTDILFVESDDLYLTDGSIIESATTICIKRAVFQKYV